MGSKFSHLSDADRWAVENKLREGWSYAAIGRFLNRHRSTIMREARRGHWVALDRYLSEFGRRVYQSGRRAAGRTRRKLDPAMRSPAWTPVLFGLHQGWSPQQLCDRLKDGVLPSHVVPPGLHSLSHETIYRAIYGMPPGQQHRSLVQLLRLSRSGRRRPRKANARRFTGIQNMLPIQERPIAADLRLEPGHIEGDLIKGAGGRSGIGVLVDRFTRRTLLVKLPSLSAPDVSRAFQARLRTLPAHMRRTLTYDRGTEMACHEHFTRQIGMPVYFCDPYSPWQRPTNENTNGLIRQYLPKGMDLSTVTRRQLNRIERLLNGRPRRVLGRKTPDEIHAIELLTFQQALPA